MRIKYQVNEVDMMFKYLDRYHMGYITYQDFCLLSDECRRNLYNTNFDDERLRQMQKTKEDEQTWTEHYLQNTDMADLEKMSK